MFHLLCPLAGLQEQLEPIPDVAHTADKLPAPGRTNILLQSYTPKVSLESPIQKTGKHPAPRRLELGVPCHKAAVLTPPLQSIIVFSITDITSLKMKIKRP